MTSEQRDLYLRAVGQLNEAEVKLRGARLTLADCREFDELDTLVQLVDRLSRRVKGAVNDYDLVEMTAKIRAGELLEPSRERSVAEEQPR